MKKTFGVLAFAFLLGVGANDARADICNGFANNLVANCGFESGSFDAWAGSTTTSFQSGVDQLSPDSGTYGAYLGAVKATTMLTQTLRTTPGLTYLVEFALMNDTSPSLGSTNDFSAVCSATYCFPRQPQAPTATSCTLLSTASATTSSLSFASRNDSGYFDLDSISVTASTPEPASWLLIGTGFGVIATWNVRQHYTRTPTRKKIVQASAQQ